MSETQTKLSNFKAGAIKRKLIVVTEAEMLTQRTLQEGSRLPLVVEPRNAGFDLLEWSGVNSETVEGWLRTHGAILFRGFDMDNPLRFEQFAQNLCKGSLFQENGEHPRQNVTGKVYTPVFYPSDRFLLWHNENSFNHQWPLKIWFGCACPADRGGETPVVDSRLVYQNIPSEIRERFERLGVMYMRNYGDGLGLNWQTVFQTNSREEVEEQCRVSGVRFEWKSGGRLRTKCVRPGVIRHPHTDEMSWFNQAQHWHVSLLDQQTRTIIESVFDEDDWPRHCYYGDGSPIHDTEMSAILEVYERLEQVFEWQRGDVMLMDNILAAHARRPYEGERHLYVAMGEMGTYEDLAHRRSD
jgi:alpha-ketoglutarate-dependent taurine dioxygenase